MTDVIGLFTRIVRLSRIHLDFSHFFVLFYFTQTHTFFYISESFILASLFNRIRCPLRAEIEWNWTQNSAKIFNHDHHHYHHHCSHRTAITTLSLNRVNPKTTLGYLWLALFCGGQTCCCSADWVAMEIPFVIRLREDIQKLTQLGLKGSKMWLLCEHNHRRYHC